jgi:signal transduction histidine kinase
MGSERVGEVAADAAGTTADTPEVRAAIARAKLEWECTVDALPDLMCLLDSRGQLLRVNRVCERWRLGSVAEVLGRDLHGVLHPRCNQELCQLHEFLRSAWSSLQSGGPAEFEVRDALLERALHVTLRRMTPSPASAASEPLAVAVVADVTALHLAREALNTINSELESRVRMRTDALADANRDLQNEIVRRESAEQALRRSRNELATLSRQLITAQEMERKRIARELHDSVGQQLSAIKYGLERGAELVQQQRLNDTKPILHRAVVSLQEAMEEIRGIAMNLRPPVLDDLGAASAVSWFCREFAQSYPNLVMREAIAVVDADIPERLATQVFRSLQELLNNVAKHAQARQVLVSLTRTSEQLVLEVLDDGVGLEAAVSSASMRSGRGMRNLRERAEMTGGQLFLQPGTGGVGTRARIEWTFGTGEFRKLDPAQVAAGS